MLRLGDSAVGWRLICEYAAPHNFSIEDWFLVKNYSSWKTFDSFSIGLAHSPNMIAST
jgi:hypothetical protein